MWKANKGRGGGGMGSQALPWTERYGERLSYNVPNRIIASGEGGMAMHYLDPAMVTALAAFVSSLAGLIWALRRQA